jgi:hypothetical protein
MGVVVEEVFAWGAVLCLRSCSCVPATDAGACFGLSSKGVVFVRNPTRIFGTRRAPRLALIL